MTSSSLPKTQFEDKHHQSIGAYLNTTWNKANIKDWFNNALETNYSD